MSNELPSHAESPEKRYVCLHRTIEQGHATDRSWSELSAVCYRLGYVTEAIKRAQEITDPAIRHRTEMRLVHKGVMRRPTSPPKAKVQRSPGQGSSSGDGRSSEDDRSTAVSTSFREEVTDSFAYLFLEHIPYTVIAITLVFPLVIGVGGMLTAGTDAWVFPAIALLPVLFMIVLVGALARQILLDTTNGLTDPPPINELPRLAVSAFSFVRDSAIVALALTAPGILILFLDTSIGLLMSCSARPAEG